MSTRILHRIAATLLVPSFLLSPSLLGGDRPRVLAVASSKTGVEIAFVNAPAGVVDTGTIVAQSGTKRATITTRTVRLRIGEPSQEPRGTASLHAFLETPDPRCTIRVDGIVLTAAPRLIQRHAPIGITVPHRIEIEVPIQAAEGPLVASIGWEVTTD